jgi:nitroreductase
LIPFKKRNTFCLKPHYCLDLRKREILVEKHELLSVILKRRSVRAFKPDEIPQVHIDQFVEALRWAPSAGNRQPWHFYLVRRPELKRDLARAAFQQDFVAQAPLVFVISGLPERSASRYGERGKELYVFQDTAAAIQNLLLLATALGYGTCWVGAFDELQVSEVLSLPKQERPLALIPIGKAAEQPSPPQRLPVEKIVTTLE